MKKYLPASLVLVFILNLFAFIPVVGANESLDTLAPNNLLNYFFDGIKNDIFSARHNFINSVGLYKKSLDSEPVFQAGTSLEGVSQKNSTSSEFYNSSSTLYYEEYHKKSGFQTEMNLITKNDTIFVRFPYATNKALKNKWIDVPATEYYAFGKAMEMGTLFEEAVIEHGTSDELLAMEKSLELARKHKLYAHFDMGENKDLDVLGATRYDLSMNREAIVPYYKDLAKILPDDLKAKTLLSVEGFEKNLSKKTFVDYLSENMFVSLWFDDKTGLPVRYYSVTALPPTKANGNQIMLIASDFSWTEINKPITLKVPAKTVTMDSVVKALDLDISSEASNPEVEAQLEDYLAQLKKATSKSDKAFLNYMIAVQYDILDDYKSAVKYYKTSASLYKKGSADQYEALAQVEWNLGNAKKAKEYFELALKKAPNEEFILQSYGWFVLGLTPVTAKEQDLKYALKLNEQLVKLNPVDGNLLNLYLSYILNGKYSDATKLQFKFDQFETGENYITIARAYHRLGQKTLTENYKKLAIAKGYKLTEADKEFFALSFN
jgi:tetratricopeptide (TPR) repeat protein